ncbi:MAG: malonic semialdehyde reductase [Phycisphaerales bacterium]
MAPSLTASHDPVPLERLFTNARTHGAWQPVPVEDELLHRLYDMVKFGPTSANCCPMRLVFVRSPEAKERLKPCLAAGNVEKAMRAPVTAIVAMDMEFYERVGALFPHADTRSWYAGKPVAIEAAAMLNTSLQAGYLIIAARALGLDCGPMGGFDKTKVDAEFLAGTSWRSLLLCNLGYGEPTKLHPRLPRLSFDEACRMA